MNEMELQPLIDGECAKDWVIDDFGVAESFAGLDRGCVEPFEIATGCREDGGKIEFAGRNDVFGRLAAFRENPQSNQRKRIQPLLERLTGGDGGVFLEAPLKTFGSAEIRALEMLHNFDDRPLIGMAARRALGTAAAGLRFDDGEALLQVAANHVQMRRSVQ